MIVNPFCRTKTALTAVAALVCSACVPILGIGDGEDYPLVMVKDDSIEEASAIGSPDVVEYGDGFLMVYAQGGRAEANATESRRNRGRVGLAASQDGIAWDKRGSILSPSSDGSWDSWFLDTPCIVYAGGIWFLYYFGDDDNDAPGGAIGAAISADLVTWTRVSNSPVLSPGASGDWDANWVESPSVRFDESTGTFHMWYTGVDADWVVRIGHATSSDGVSWTKDGANPVLRERNIDRSDWFVWDGVGAGVASVVRVDGAWYLFYASQNLFNTWAGLRVPAIGLATSPDGSSFARYGDDPLFGQSETGNQPNGPYNPGALHRGDYWYVWYETGYGIGLIRARAIAGDW